MRRLLLVSLLLSWVSAPEGFAQGRMESGGRPRLVPASDKERCASGDVDACNRARRDRSYGSLETTVETWRNTADGRAACFLVSALCDKAEEVANGMDSGIRWANDAWDGVAGAVDGAAGAVDSALDWGAGAVDDAAEWAPDARDGAAAYFGSGHEGPPAYQKYGYESSADPGYEWSTPAAGASALTEGAPAYYDSGYEGAPSYHEPGYESSAPAGRVDVEPDPDYGYEWSADPGYEWSTPAAGASALTEGVPAYYDSGVIGCSGLTDCQVINGEVIAGPSLDSGIDPGVEWLPAEAGGAPAYHDVWQRPTAALLTSDEVDAMRARILDDIADERSRGEAEMAAMRERQGGFGKALGGFFKGLGSVGSELLKNSDVIANTLLNNGNGNWFPPPGNGLASTTFDSFPTTFDCNWMSRMAGQAWPDNGISMSDCQEARTMMVNEGFLGSDGSFLSLEQSQRKIQELLAVVPGGRGGSGRSCRHSSGGASCGIP